MALKSGSKKSSSDKSKTGTWKVKAGLAQMLKGGVIMDVVTPEQAKIAEDAGACSVMALERVPSCLLYTSPSPRDATLSRMPSSA